MSLPWVEFREFAKLLAHALLDVLEGVVKHMFLFTVLAVSKMKIIKRILALPRKFIANKSYGTKRGSPSSPIRAPALPPCLLFVV